MKGEGEREAYSNKKMGHWDGRGGSSQEKASVSDGKEKNFYDRAPGKREKFFDNRGGGGGRGEGTSTLRSRRRGKTAL